MWWTLIIKYWKTILIVILFSILISIAILMVACSCITGIFEGGFIRPFGLAGNTGQNNDYTNNSTENYPDILINSCDELKNIPSEYINDINKAAKKFNVDPAIILAIFKYGEHYGGQEDPQNVPWPTAPWASSPVGASGPFQFMPETWSEYKVDGNNDGKADIQNFTDSAYAAAKYIKYIETFSKDQSDIGGGYNAGPGTIAGKKYLNYDESRRYSKRVVLGYYRFKKCINENK